MQINWSVMLNVVLLAGVVIAIMGMIRARRGNNSDVRVRSPIPTPVAIPTEKFSHDDVISVRQIKPEEPSIRVVAPTVQAQPAVAPVESRMNKASNPSVMIFLLAKDNRQLAGYDFLQTVLSSGLRFGEGQLFHRHQYPNGQGPVLCSLAAATASGVFDLQNIGAFMVRGLCLFMHASGNTTIDSERLEIMLDTARLLSEGLDTHLLDDKRQPLSDQSITRYCQILSLGDTLSTNEKIKRVVDEEYA